jgi:hypothetical protein
MRQVSKGVTTILACTFPILSIVVLYLVESMSKRLGVITVLTTLFSLVLVLTTSARTVDIFAATAA